MITVRPALITYMHSKNANRKSTYHRHCPEVTHSLPNWNSSPAVDTKDGMRPQLVSPQQLWENCKCASNPYVTSVKSQPWFPSLLFIRRQRGGGGGPSPPPPPTY